MKTAVERPRHSVSYPQAEGTGGEVRMTKPWQTDVHVQRARKNSGETAVLASALDSQSDLKDKVSSLSNRVSSNTEQIESLSETVDEALQSPNLEELEGEITTEDGSLSEKALTHLTELNKAQAGMAGGALVTAAGTASANPGLMAAGLSLALGGPVALNALEGAAKSDEEISVSGEFIDPLADAVAKRLEERGYGGESQGLA